MSQECVPWSANVIAAEKSKNSTRRRILSFSSLSSLSTRHFPPFQSSHPAIEIPPISLKTIIEKFFNRHTLCNCDDSDTKLKEILDQTKIVNRYTRKLEIP
jgi:hypothetical protein